MPRTPVDHQSVVEIEITDDNSPASDSQAESIVDDVPQANEEICPDAPLTARVEALLIGADRPLPDSRIAGLIGISGKGAAKSISKAIDELNLSYREHNCSFRIERLAGGWQILTLPQFGPVLNRLHTDRQQSKLSQPALETLAIIAYRQPIMRAEVEAIRGVASGEVLRGLLERRLIKIVGRAEELGRPMLYGTTKEFLKVFGLASLDDMPIVQGLAHAKSSKAPLPSSAPANSAEANPTTPSAE